MKNVLQLLEKSANQYPDKIVFTDEFFEITYNQFNVSCKRVGSSLLHKGYNKQVIAIYMDQSIYSLISMFGIVYAGCVYVVIDSKMPVERIRNIFNTVKPSAVICSNESHQKMIDEVFSEPLLLIDDLCKFEEDRIALSLIREKQIDTDPLYVLFTSGSTGVPKGTVVTHKNVLSYSKWFCDAFFINNDTNFGNQTPFYFSMSVSDIYSTLRSGATLHIIPKKLFSFPIKLLEYILSHNIDTLYWVPSALCIVADWKALDYVQNMKIKRVLFAGESMPTKQLNYWISKFPNATFANLFGPTETTDICCYYVVNRTLSDTDNVPIGFSCNNCECLIINGKGELTENGEIGELYVRGSFVSPGYFNNPEKTADVFVQNPLQNAYPEIVYRTGDLVRKNQYNEMEYICRKDYQIKHMGYRIGLGEIESASNLIDGIKISVVLYDKEIDEIILIYNGKKLDAGYLTNALSKRLPSYMLPNRIIRIREVPYNSNGKLDRSWLQSHYQEL